MRALLAVCPVLLAGLPGCGREAGTGSAEASSPAPGSNSAASNLAAPNTADSNPAAPAPAQARALFDGVSLAGWEGDPSVWSVEDGELVGRTRAAQPLPRSTWLVWTGGEPADFELTLAYKLVRGNSGVQFRSRVVGAHNVAGYQADLADEQGLTGSLYEQFGRARTLAAPGERTRFAAGGKGESERFGAPEEFARLARPGEWNELRIRAVGARSEVFLNGVRTAELVDESPRQASLSGVLALQLHSGPPMEVRFRDIRLVDLGGRRDTRARIEPLWIWSHARPAADEEAWFQTRFELAPGVQRATLYAVADDGFEAYLNGVLVAEGEGTEKTQQVDVLARLQPGENVLALWAHNIDGPAALMATLQLEGEGGLRVIGSDATWRAAVREPRDWLRASDDPAWGTPHALGPIGTEPWPRPSNQVKHARLTALPGEEVSVPEGFVCELVYSVPRARQGSWVALTFDDAGRAYAADQHGFLYRVELDSNGAVERVERVPVELGEAQGLCWAFDALYVVVNGTKRFASGLYRVTDSDADERLDRVELLRAFVGNDEHGPHAVVLGPGEELHVVGGYEVAPPAEGLAEWGPSFLPVGRLPIASQRVELSEFELVQQGATGWVARTDRDGKAWELVAVGLRNAYDLAFDRAGRLYAFDSDMEWDLGLPWYVPTRVLEVVERGDHGFRVGSARWPTWFPDSLPAVVDAGRSSPTGMLSGAGLAFPAPYREAIFCGDWLKGRIFAFTPASDGAGSARLEVFASGKPLPVTDLARGPEGRLYFTTGGRHAQSGLYRVRALDPGEAGEVAPAARADDFAALRAGPLEEVRSALADARTARVARAALEARPLAEWAGSIEAELDAHIRAQLELALARAGSPEQVARLLGVLAAREIDPQDLAGARLALRTLELALLRAAPVAADLRARLAERLLAVFPCGEVELDRQLGVLLASLPEAEQRFVPLALARMQVAGVGAEGFHWAFVLRHATRGWSAERRRVYFEWLRAADLGLVGGRAMPTFLAALRQDALATLDEAERAALGALLEPGVEVGFAPSEVRPFVRAWTAAELEPELARLEEPRDLVRGARLLREASCLTCHRIEGRGLAVGPELDGLAGRFGAQDLLRSLLEPSRDVPDRFRDTEIRTVEGELVVGKIVGGDEASVLVRESYGTQGLVRIARAEIESLEPSRLSPMPEGLLDGLELDEVLDLMAYLLQDG